jgi:DNA-directed RNA polymerase subunit RPC12/RpoP
MAVYTTYTCNACGFFTKGNFSNIAYNINEKGEREFVPHARSGPFDGYLHQAVCLDCLHQFKLDFKNDELKCSTCNSKNVVRTFETRDKPCPKCKNGTITEIMDIGFTI